MGIPHFFGHIARSHPEVLLKPEARDLRRCSRLFLDFNCVVHQCANVVLLASPSSPKADTSTVSAAIITASIVYLDELIAVLRPRHGTYVAVDGVPPRAKMEQQRQRRFMSTWTCGASPVAKPPIIWDRNMITPGTEFMQDLADALASWASACPDQRVVSDSNDPGEGEQKIFARLRGGTDMDHADDMDCVFGLDADLCMMTVSLEPARADRIVILRDPADRSPMQFVDGRALRRAMLHEIEATESLEYAAMALCLGNDFVPALPGLIIVDGGVDLMTRLYRNQDDSFRLIAADGHLDVAGMTLLLGAVADQEDTMCRAAERRYYDRVRQRRSVVGGHTYTSASHPLHRPWPVEGTIRAGDAGWRATYYRYLFGGLMTTSTSTSDDDGDLWRICREYCRALDWALRYVSMGDCLDEGWFYPHVHAPTAQDLHRFMCSMTTTSFESLWSPCPSARIVVPPSLHLLAVLPIANAVLLRPAALANVHRDPELGCTHMYPIDFAIRTYLHTYLWQCQPLLPTMDLERLRIAHDRVLLLDDVVVVVVV